MKKNEQKNSYLSIDCSNYFKESSDEENYIIKCKDNAIRDFNNNNDLKYDLFVYIKKIKNKYLEKYFPEQKEDDNFAFSLHLSKYFCNKKKLKKDSIEQYINYFFNRRVNITYSNAFILSIEGMESIGNILSYIYKKCQYYKIKSKKEIKDNINTSYQKSVNVLTDFYNYCVKKNLSPNDENKSLFWSRKENNYNLPPHLLFLLNLFNNISIFEFNLNFQDETFTNDRFKYFILVLMNIDLFLYNFKHIRCNLIHEKFQNIYYSAYHQKILSKMCPDALKINSFKENKIFSRKWIFEKNFMLEEFRNIEFYNKKKKNEITQFGDFTVLENQSQSIFNDYFLQKGDSINDIMELENIYLSYNQIMNQSYLPEKKRSGTIQNKYYNLTRKKSLNDVNIENYLKNNNNKYIFEIIEKYHYCFELLFILFNNISNYRLENIDLIMNESYTTEFLYYFKHELKIDIAERIFNFHLLDLYTPTQNQIRAINLEIDSFDLNTFNKILYIILNNPRIKELKISFFTCDINYFPFTLYRTYIRFSRERAPIINSENNESKILEYFYPYFKANLLYLFYLIKRKGLNKLGLNFDIPLLLQKKDNYMITIMKFLLNFFIYLNDPNCKINELTLLSPKTILDGRLLSNIDYIFEEMDANISNIYLYDLNIQFTIYKIPHIKNIISRNLINLSIGDLDLTTLESIVNYFHSYTFANGSLLRKLNIKLLKNIDCLSPKLKIILRSLFNIKLKNLKKLCLYTNIIIKSQKECSYLIKILKDNWISSYTLIVNEASKKILKDNLSKNIITFLVPHNLENELIGEKNNNKNVWTNSDDVVYWYLKYKFNNLHYYISRNFKAHKYYIYNILKYLYFIKRINIFYDIQSSEEDNKK